MELASAEGSSASPWKTVKWVGPREAARSGVISGLAPQHGQQAEVIGTTEATKQTLAGLRPNGKSR